VLAVACQNLRLIQESGGRLARRSSWTRSIPGAEHFGAMLVDHGEYTGPRGAERLLASGYETAQVHYNLCVVYARRGGSKSHSASKARDRARTGRQERLYQSVADRKLQRQVRCAGIFDEHRRFGAALREALRGAGRSTGRGRAAWRGYVSPDFRIMSSCASSSPYSRGTTALASRSSAITTLSWEDDATERLRKLPEHWVDCGRMSDAELIERVRADRIDILVDLTGHTGDNRLLVFTQKPAPVQATYLGYPGTTGISAIGLSAQRRARRSAGEAEPAERRARAASAADLFLLPRAGGGRRARLRTASGARGRARSPSAASTILPKISDTSSMPRRKCSPPFRDPGMILKSRALSIAHIAEGIASAFAAEASTRRASSCGAGKRRSAVTWGCTVKSISASTAFPTTARPPRASGCGWACRSSA